jgi:hypothetical protein
VDGQALRVEADTRAETYLERNEFTNNNKKWSEIIPLKIYFIRI